MFGTLLLSVISVITKNMVFQLPYCATLVFIGINHIIKLNKWTLWEKSGTMPFPSRTGVEPQLGIETFVKTSNIAESEKFIYIC